MFGAYAFAAGYFGQGPVITIVASVQGDIVDATVVFCRSIRSTVIVSRSKGADAIFRRSVDVTEER